MDIDDLLNNSEPVYYTSYSIRSFLNYGEPNRYCQAIDCEIKADTDREGVDSKLKLVGRIEAYKVLVGIALNEGVSISDVFDAHQITMDIGSEIFDFEEADFNNSVHKYYRSEFLGPDVLIISRMEILPEFRGLNVGKRAIRDLYNNFISGCGLMALKCFPFQHESRNHYKESAFGKSMLYWKIQSTMPLFANRLGTRSPIRRTPYLPSLFLL